MKAIIQRVTHASVAIDGKVKSSIGLGLLVLLGIEDSDTKEDIEWLSSKIINLRIFNDADGKMNLNVEQAGGSLLVISQFTLYGDVRRGRRPSFDAAAPPEKAQLLYEYFVASAKSRGLTVQTGVFRAAMLVNLVNDGPVTFFVDSKLL